VSAKGAGDGEAGRSCHVQRRDGTMAKLSIRGIPP